MMGNESTEESRKEISSRPGAPSPAANATTLCFQPLKDNPNSSSQSSRIPRHSNLFGHKCKGAATPFRTISLADSAFVLEQRKGRSARLLRECGAVEVIHEDLH